MTKALELINKGERALQQASDIHEIIDLRDQAKAIQVLADAKGFAEASQKAKLFQLKAERKAGNWLHKNIKVGNPQLSQDVTIRLEDIGINRKESSRWQLGASVHETDFNEWIEERLDKNIEITASGLRRLAIKLRPKPKPIPFPTGTYRIIYADPPWQFDNSGFEESANSHYPTMNTEDLALLEIPQSDVLLLWATNAMLEDALFVMKQWGYNYKTNFVWIKTKGPSIGWFAQSRHELLLLGVNGSGHHPEKKFVSWFDSSVGTHSRKPDLVYEMIEEMYEGPYLELFARRNRNGWTSWGNEINQTIEN